MNDRSSIKKKMSAQVIGGICKLISEPKSIIPYINELINVIQYLMFQVQQH